MFHQPVVLVTGGAQGLGKAIASKLASQGDCVVILDWQVEKGAHTVAMLQGQGLEVYFFAGDTGKVEDCRNVMDWIKEKFGRLDGLVNNAGLSFFKSIDNIEISEFKQVLDVNLTAAFVLTKFAAPLLRQSPQAAIVNISSTRALMSEPANEAYATSKAGLLGLTHALANSLGPAVRVNAICPGWIDVREDGPPLSYSDHSQHPAGRVGKPEDVANLAAFLLSGENSFITGQAFVVDGGMTKKMIYEE